jgi:hypothetical protein
MRLLVIVISLFILNFSTLARADIPFTLFPSHYVLSATQTVAVRNLLEKNFSISQFRGIKAQIITNTQGQPDHLLLFLLTKQFHGVTVTRINLDTGFQQTKLIKNYRLTPEDYAQQPVLPGKKPQCPDASTDLITFAPNDDDVEQLFTKIVGDAGKTHHLNVVRLLHYDATRKNYLNYMVCPNLKGNFYDGDSTPDFILTVDGIISAAEISTLLKNQFKFKTINIWLACQAFNDPMRSAVLEDAQSQKYVAGISDLFVGPSDAAAACTMVAAIEGKSIRKSFDYCYQALDTPEDDVDIWGFSGNGSDYFGE